MPRSSPDEYRRRYLQLCRFKWEFLRRNKEYIQAFKEKKPPPPEFGFVEMRDPSEQDGIVRVPGYSGGHSLFGRFIGGNEFCAAESEGNEKGCDIRYH